MRNRCSGRCYMDMGHAGPCTDATLTGFVCPQCKSPYWRTEGNTETGTGICKGKLTIVRGMTDYSGCTFTWPRRDDAKVFQKAKS